MNTTQQVTKHSKGISLHLKPTTGGEGGGGGIWQVYNDKKKDTHSYLQASATREHMDATTQAVEEESIPPLRGKKKPAILVPRK